jgi:hypothetical protein
MSNQRDVLTVSVFQTSDAHLCWYTRLAELAAAGTHTRLCVLAAASIPD